ncbi:MAG: hypothetical protein JXA33_10710 [Anaerolineae bacterium]|nr:hypothetical protein [Anaerolineae bacterium]
MTNKISEPASSRKKTRSFRIQGQIRREQPEAQPGELKLMAYVFDKAGVPLGSANLDDKGNYSVAVRLAKPADVEVMVGPADMARQIRSSSAYRESFSARDWKGEGEQYILKFDALLPLDIWRPWWPVRICVSGHVRKVSYDDGIHICPVPYVKVEIFDVDREFCFWPYLRRWWKLLLDKPVMRIPELMKEPPIPLPPFPDPDPVPDLDLIPIPSLRTNRSISRLEQISSNPQPEPPGNITQPLINLVMKVAASPQSEVSTATVSQHAFTRVGEASLMDNNIASRLDKLTLTSKTAPWLIFPRCFYSKAEVCETTTDCDGYFNCCFRWWPFHFRHGRLRFDSRPDIIIKVTQVIDSVSTVIYLDPYTSTRWNVTNAHIDLYLDDENVVCGPGCSGDPQPEGKTVFFTRVGNDYVYDIDQVAGTYHGGSYSNVAYGHSLNFQATLGEGLTEATGPYYYRLSIGPGKGATAGPFKPITSSLSDTRVAKITFNSESYTLGPQVVNGEPALYEIRNTKDYYWYWPDRIGSWYTPTDVPDEGLYTVRLEIFDKNGNKLTAPVIDYRDGTKKPPAVMPSTGTDYCDLVLQIDNIAPTIMLDIPKASDECGVVKFTDVPFVVKPSVTQANGRLWQWSLNYVKGLSSGETPMVAESSVAGLSPLPRPLPGAPDITSAPFTAGLTSTCAFSLIVDAWSHIRNGYGWVYYKRLIKAVAVEKCLPCPPCP